MGYLYGTFEESNKVLYEHMNQLLCVIRMFDTVSL
jgi:hypothetical protein